MAKRKITATAVRADIEAGLDDFALMKKYHLSAVGIERLLNKMINSGAITPTELEDRMPNLEKTVELGLFFCSACGNTESNEFTTCPRCGFTPAGPHEKQACRAGSGQEDPYCSGEFKPDAALERRSGSRPGSWLSGGLALDRHRGEAWHHSLPVLRWPNYRSSYV